MDVDFASLAARIATDVQDLRGVVIVSRDGLVLGAHPVDAERVLKPAWLRFAALGDVEKGFIQFPGEMWVFIRSGPYASFAVSNSLARPGLVLDGMEQVLLETEEVRTRTGGVRLPESPEVPRSKPRAPLHPEPRPAERAPASPAPPASQFAEAADQGYSDLAAMAQGPQAGGGAEPPQAAASFQPSAPSVTQPAPEAPRPLEAPGLVPQEAAAPTTPAPPEREEEVFEVDRVALAQEFARLLDESGYDDEDGAS